jgi:hypothetical protein
MPTTCKLIAKSVLGASASSVDFQSIPSTYTDLLLLASARQDVVYLDCYLRLNNDSGSNYSYRRLTANGASAASASASSQTWLSLFPLVVPSGYTSSTFSNFEVYIPNYAGSTNKSVSATGASETNATTAYIGAIAGLWSQTTAIDRVTVLPDTGANFVSGSSFFLYGITKA